MTDPKKEQKKELKLTKQEIIRNEKVTKLSTTDEFANKMKTTQGVEMNKETGKGTPIKQKRRIQVAKKGSGKNTRVIGEDGSVLYQASPGTAKEKAMLKKLKNQEADTNRRRSNNADVVNYQTGDGEGNRVYDSKLAAQTAKKIFIKKKKQ
jgi:hypothetical protein